MTTARAAKNGKPMPWFKCHGMDLVEGMRGLTDAQYRTYNTVLCLIYCKRGGALEFDPGFIAGYSGQGVTVVRRAVNDLVAIGKLEVTDDGLLINERAAFELKTREKVSEDRAFSGEKGGKVSGNVRAEAARAKALDEANASNGTKQTPPDKDSRDLIPDGIKFPQSPQGGGAGSQGFFDLGDAPQADASPTPSPATPPAAPENNSGKKSRPKKSEDYTPEFELFWTSYPKIPRQLSDKVEAFAKWQVGVARFGAATIMAARDHYMQLPNVRKDAHQFAKRAQTFLNGYLSSAVAAYREDVESGCYTPPVAAPITSPGLSADAPYGGRSLETWFADLEELLQARRWAPHLCGPVPGAPGYRGPDPALLRAGARDEVSLAPLNVKLTTLDAPWTPSATVGGIAPAALAERFPMARASAGERGPSGDLGSLALEDHHAELTGAAPGAVAAGTEGGMRR